jgi:hypothetical protein
MPNGLDAVTITRPPTGVTADVAREYERAVRDVLAGEDGPVEVQFGAWVAEDGHIQVVCRVETTAAEPFGLALQWRWWSPLLDSPDALHQELGAAVARRRLERAQREAAATLPSAVGAGPL